MSDLMTKVIRLLAEREDEMIAMRRHLHEHPELSFEEKETAAYIARFYEGKDCIVKTGVGGGNGITVDIQGGKSGGSLALRADFDALPINEETGLPFASKVSDVMHACGHDAHTAYMMVLADVLIQLKKEWPGMIRILHQPAEETPPGGALGMIKDGCLDNIDHVIGAHVMTNLPLGEIGYHAGPAQTGRSGFHVRIQGKGGHGAMPQETCDPIVGGAQFVTALQTIVSRRIDPMDAVSVTVGSFDAKGKANIIKDSIELLGDVRVMKESNRRVVEKEFKRILAGICDAYNLTYELNYTHDYPVLVNDVALTNQVADILRQSPFKQIAEAKEVPAMSPSEDFAYYAAERPSCFIYIGAIDSGKEVYPHHHPKFYIDERCILLSAQAVGCAAMGYLLNHM